MESSNNFLLKKKVSIDYHGNLKYQPKYFSYLNVAYHLIFLAITYYIFLQYPYYPVTFTGHTDYSFLLSSICDKIKIPNKLCVSSLKHYYVAAESEESLNFFHPTLEEEGILLPLSHKELEDLKTHTNLVISEDLSFLDSINEFYLISFQRKPGSPLLKVRKIAEDFWLLSDFKDSWLTTIIINDHVDPLKINGTLIGTVVTETENQENGYDVTRNQEETVIICPGKTLTFKKKEAYHFNNGVLTVIKKQRNYSSSFTLEDPRDFMTFGIYNFHPFHFPRSQDLCTSMILAFLALLKCQKMI